MAVSLPNTTSESDGIKDPSMACKLCDSDRESHRGEMSVSIVATWSLPPPHRFLRLTGISVCRH